LRRLAFRTRRPNGEYTLPQYRRAWERQSPDWRGEKRQSGDWRSQVSTIRFSADKKLTVAHLPKKVP
jgi:hypothetical protein